MEETTVDQISHGGERGKTQVGDQPAVDRNVDVVVELAALESFGQIQLSQHHADHYEVKQSQNYSESLIGSKA